MRPSVRIALCSGKDVLKFSTLGRVEILEVSGNSATKKGSLRGRFTVKRTNQLLEVFHEKKGRLGAVTGSLRINSSNSYNTIEAESLTYRGSMEIVHGVKNKMTLINIVNIEEYLRGVLPYEMPANDKGILEALKAQAVAARTYALSHQNQFSNLAFDMYADERDQVYRGIKSETFISDKAVAQTRGILLMYKEKLVLCYYHSTCGGHTADISQVWGRDTVAYLSALPDKDLQGNNYCKASQYTNWYEGWDHSHLTDIIKRNLKSGKPDKNINFNRLTGLAILSRTRSGRVQILEIKTDKGPVFVRGDKIRWVLRRSGNDKQILPSSWFKIEKYDSRILIRGRGFGHGIGMCQTGAMGRARTGQTFDEILSAYYQGTRLVRMK
jgi:stage II sporulation protein D